MTPETASLIKISWIREGREFLQHIFLASMSFKGMWKRYHLRLQKPNKKLGLIKGPQLSHNRTSKMKHVLITCQLQEFLKVKFALFCLQKYKN